MYSGESKGEKFPHIQFGVYGPSPQSNEQGIALDFGPEVPSIYPEYLTDPNISMCPSDAEASGFTNRIQYGPNGNNDPNGDSCFGFYDSNGGYCMRTVDESYFYLGYVFDRWDTDDPTDTLATLVALVSALLDPDELPDPSESGPAQFTDWAVSFLNGALPFALAETIELNAYSDRDIEVAPGNGNGGGTATTIYRLREGIERFLITDINNPAASAQAQSEVFVMYDHLSTNVQSYNHIPGGANVLYMDGHVSWSRYPGTDGPVNEISARVAGALTAGN
jgi:prepilin-type processing-associated H-X9-DG protein